jgi:PAS domain S-box-containing protein
MLYAKTLQQEVQTRTQELEAERAQLQAFFQATGEGIFYSTDRNILLVNQKLCDMLGYEESELVGQRSFLFRPDDLSEEEIANRNRISNDLKTDGVSHAEFWFKRKDGTIFMAAVTASLVAFEGDSITAVTIVRDITQELARKEQQDRFIRNAAHELRNPISALNTRVYVALKKEQVVRDDIERIDRISSKMGSLVSSLLDLSRYQSDHIDLKKDTFVAQKALVEVYDIQSLIAQQENIDLVFDTPDDPIPIVADELRFYQIVTNLVSNALNYTASGGQVRVTLNYRTDAKDEIILKVSDNGVGIAQEHLSELFEPFFRIRKSGHKEGVGLGLSITKQLVEAHNGSIDVQSLWGVGTTFIVILPTGVDEPILDET